MLSQVCGGGSVRDLPVVGATWPGDEDEDEGKDDTRAVAEASTGSGMVEERPDGTEWNGGAG